MGVGYPGSQPGWEQPISSKYGSHCQTEIALIENKTKGYDASGTKKLDQAKFNIKYNEAVKVRHAMESW